MSRNEDTTVNEKNIGGIGRNRGPRAGSDLSGGVTRVEGEKGLETPDRTGTNGRARPRSWFRQLGRVIGDPVELITSEVPVEVDPLVKLVARTIAGAGGDDPDRPTMRLTSERGGKVVSDRIEERLWHKSILVADRVVAAMKAQPIERQDRDRLLLELDGSREVLKAASSSSSRLPFGDLARIDNAIADARDEINGLRDDVRAAEKAFEESKAREDRYSADNQALRAELAAEREATDFLEKDRADIRKQAAWALACLAGEPTANWDWVDHDTRKAVLSSCTAGTFFEPPALAAERAKVAELSKVRVFNVAGLVEKDLAERYESLRESFDKLADHRARLRTELRKARALIAESAPVVRYVERLASLSDEDADSLDARDIRSMARDNFANREAWASALDPRTYTEIQRRYAADVLVLGPRSGQTKLETVDAVAEALGMRKGK